ncbi:MAG: immunoglobulin domain-containing protein [Opitutaceae bacterium]|nr:immunoglobulin domain-containing protein [Opitutaceae bacterium]
MHSPRFPLLPIVVAVLGLIVSRPLTSAQTQPTWTNLAHGLGAGYDALNSVAFGNGTFVAIAGTPIPSATGPAVPIRIATSTDGLAWTARSINNTLFRPGVSRVRFLNGRFVVYYGGQTAADFGSPTANFIATSTDGVAWTNIAQTTASNFTEMVFVNGRYYAVTGSTIISSADLAAWTTHPTPLTGIYSYLDIAFGNGRFFATTNGAGGVVTSTDGSTWTQVPFFAQLGGYRAEFLDGTWFFYSQGNNAVSTDGTTFTTVTRATNDPGGTANILAINGRYIAPGPGYFWAGLNGRNWARFGNWPTIAGSLFNSYNEVAFGAGRYVAVGGAFGPPNPALIITLAESAAPALEFPVAPSITTPPAPTNAVLGGSATFSVSALGIGNAYQWLKDNVNIAGATAASYTIATVTAASAGNYSVRITNSLGTTTSTPVALTIVTASAVGRLINLSVLTDLATATDEFTLGYVVGGAGTSGGKPLVLRAAGPSLGALGVAGTIADPRLETFAGAGKTGENDNWGGGADVAAAMAAVGAFPYSGPTSRDAAVAASITTRDNSVRVTGVAGATGAVIAEVYDATPANSFSAATPRLLNVSVRKHLGTGLTAGFVVGGASSVRVLIRVAGPGLAQFGVPDTVVDPQLVLFRGTTQIGTNNDWANAADISAAGTSVGAFPLPANSRDAALVATLEPGNYSVRASGVNATSGVALVEVYELP